MSFALFLWKLNISMCIIDLKSKDIKEMNVCLCFSSNYKELRMFLLRTCFCFLTFFKMKRNVFIPCPFPQLKKNLFPFSLKWPELQSSASLGLLNWTLILLKIINTGSVAKWRSQFSPHALGSVSFVTCWHGSEGPGTRYWNGSKSVAIRYRFISELKQIHPEIVVRIFKYKPWKIVNVTVWVFLTWDQ